MSNMTDTVDIKNPDGTTSQLVLTPSIRALLRAQAIESIEETSSRFEAKLAAAEAKVDSLQQEVKEQGEIIDSLIKEVMILKESSEGEASSRRELALVVRGVKGVKPIPRITAFLTKQKIPFVSVQARGGEAESENFNVRFSSTSDRDKLLAVSDATLHAAFPGAVVRRDYPPEVANTNWFFGRFVKRINQQLVGHQFSVRYRCLLVDGFLIMHAMQVPHDVNLWDEAIQAIEEWLKQKSDQGKRPRKRLYICMRNVPFKMMNLFARLQKQVYMKRENMQVD